MRRGPIGQPVRLTHKLAYVAVIPAAVIQSVWVIACKLVSNRCQVNTCNLFANI
jgi:hypothetical protein